MGLKHLRIFIKVYQEKSITKAAKQLHMVQPAVSRSIQELEKHYGISLFDRLNHKIYPTDKADKLYAHAVQIIDAVDKMEETIQNDQKKDTIRVGGTMTVGNFVLPLAVAEFKKQNPDISVSVTISNSSEIQSKILNNTIDFAIVEENVPSDYLEMEYFYTDNMCLIYGKEHELDNKDKIYMKDLLLYPFLQREEGSAARTFLEHIFAVHDLVPESTWESTSTQALINAAADGLGIAILPEKLVKRDLQEGLVKTREIEDEKFKRNTYFIWHKQKVLPESVLQFKEVCKQIKKRSDH